MLASIPPLLSGRDQNAIPQSVRLREAGICQQAPGSPLKAHMIAEVARAARYFFQPCDEDPPKRNSTSETYAAAQQKLLCADRVFYEQFPS